MRLIVIIAIFLFSCRQPERISIELSGSETDAIVVYEGGNSLYLQSADSNDSAVVVTRDGKMFFQRKGRPDMPMTKDEAILKLKSMQKQYFTKYFTRTI